MLKLFTFVQVAADSLRKREEGQTMAEYGVVLAVITLAVIGAITLLSDNVRAALENVAGSQIGLAAQARGGSDDGGVRRGPCRDHAGRDRCHHAPVGQRPRCDRERRRHSARLGTPQFLREGAPSREGAHSITERKSNSRDQRKSPQN